MKTVQLLKLTTGEEILGRVSFDNGLYNITMPVNIVQDSENMGFEPFMPYAECESFDFDSSHVILAVNPTSALTNLYLHATEANEGGGGLIDTSAAPSQQGIIV